MADPVRYLTQADAAAVLGLTPPELSRLRTAGKMINPDVVIARYAGWSRRRLVRFGQEVGRLTADEVPIRQVRQPSGRPAWWDEPPREYLSSTQAGRRLGVSPGAVVGALRRGTWLPPDILIGDRLPGYDEASVVRYGRQTGRLDAQGRPVLSGRGRFARKDGPAG